MSTSRSARQVGAAPHPGMPAQLDSDVLGSPAKRRPAETGTIHGLMARDHLVTVRSHEGVATRKILVGFAVEDKQYRDLLRGQSKLGGSPINYTDMSVKEPWDSSWKTRCHQRINGCDGFIALLSKNVMNADGARWEIKCAAEERVPILGVHIHAGDDYSPPEIRSKRVIKWTWAGIANWIKYL